ncbi:MotA/TolQ/ExbB proton channel family protein [Psychroserpens damuponensis]|uniref:MotA/TolQ/ExbB proton channel family protein n=1 Tax=Psychroserpens damuponensis TaxID=943936 RepID=UPI00059157BE|nr:MotA/TolQ/ExbB proton channel family protein [Psychroserpens damuponensis]
MNTLTISCQSLFTQSIATNLFMDGGPLFMTLILLCLLASLVFIIIGFMKTTSALPKARKMMSLAVDSSLLALVIGFLGSVIGLITAFDSVEAMGNPDPAIFAGGLKVSLLTATFGLFSFVIARLGILILRLRLPVKDISE